MRERSLAATNQQLATTAKALATEEERANRIDRKLQREGDRRVALEGELAALDARLAADASKAEDLQDAVARAVAARSRAEL